MAILPPGGNALSSGMLGHLSTQFGNTDKMPVLFLGHGNPMNAIEDNEFVEGFKKVSTEIERPKAILCISAHWETNGTFVTAMERPPTIHDFGGFPQALFDVQYPAPGSVELAKETQQLVKGTHVGLDHDWGLDHGCWSVIKHMYPDADVPVIEMSIDYTQPAAYHYALAKELSVLRRKGILIVGSGNMVHNLRMAAWDKLDQPGFAFGWAMEANEKMKQFILAGNHQPLIEYRSQGRAFDLAVPTPEHYLPLLYALGLQEKQEQVSLFNDGIIAGSLNMMSVKIDRA